MSPNLKLANSFWGLIRQIYAHQSFPLYGIMYVQYMVCMCIQHKVCVQPTAQLTLVLHTGYEVEDILSATTTRDQAIMITLKKFDSIFGTVGITDLDLVSSVIKTTIGGEGGIC